MGGGALTDIQMRAFTYGRQRSMLPVQVVPEDTNSLVAEKSFYAALSLAMILGLSLSFDARTSVAIAGALTPLGLWLLIASFVFSWRRLVRAARWGKKRHAEHKWIESQTKFPKSIDLRPLHPARMLSVDIAAKRPSAARRAIVDGVFARLSRQMGLPYVSEPERKAGHPVGEGIGWDCSSLVRFIWNDESTGLVVNLDGDAADEFSEQAAAGRLLPDGNKYLQRGDLMFYVDITGKVAHVAVYEGPEPDGRAKIAAANHPGGSVKRANWAPTKRGDHWGALESNKPGDAPLYYIGASRPGPL